MLDGLSNVFGSIGEDVKGFVTERPLVAAGIGVGVLGTAGLVAGVIKRKGARKKRKKTTRGRSRDRKFISKQKHEIKRKRKKKPAKIYKKKGTFLRRKPLKRAGSKKRVGKTYYTKKGQPYKIMASGKARFIKGRRKR